MTVDKSNNWISIYWFLLVSVALLAVFFGWFSVFHLRMPFPFQDMVEVMSFLDTDPSIWTGEGITKFHDMEHRPAIPILFWHLDRVIFGSLGVMPLILSQLTFLTIAILVTNLWAPDLKLNKITSWAPTLSGVAVIFSLSNWHNLMWEKQLHLSLSLFFLIVASILVSKHDKKYFSNSGESSFGLIISINLFCWASAFSFGYGIPIIFIILLHGFLVRWPIKQLLVCSGSSVLLVFVYLYLLSLRDQGLENVVVIMHSVWSLIPYVARLLGSVFSSIGLENILRVSRGDIALIAGCIMLFFYFFGMVRYYYQFIVAKSETTQFGTAALLISSSCIGMAVITWLSRPLETGGVVDRYFIVSSLFIISLPGMFITKDYWQRSSYRGGFGLLTLVSAMLTISILGHISNYSKLSESWHFSSLAAIGANYEVYIPGPNEIIGPPLHQNKSRTQSVWERHKVRLKNHNKSIPFEWHGKQLNKLFNNLEERFCEGGVEKIIWVPGYRDTLVFIAWSKHFNSNALFSDWVLAVNNHGKIVGLGSSRRLDFLPSQISFKQRVKSIFQQDSSRNAGYILSGKDQSIDFYSITGDTVCKFSSAKTPQSY